MEGVWEWRRTSPGCASPWAHELQSARCVWPRYKRYIRSVHPLRARDRDRGRDRAEGSGDGAFAAHPSWTSWQTGSRDDDWPGAWAKVVMRSSGDGASGRREMKVPPHHFQSLPYPGRVWAPSGCLADIGTTCTRMPTTTDCQSNARAADHRAEPSLNLDVTLPVLGISHRQSVTKSPER